MHNKYRNAVTSLCCGAGQLSLIAILRSENLGAVPTQLHASRLGSLQRRLGALRNQSDLELRKEKTFRRPGHRRGLQGHSYHCKELLTAST